MKSIKTIISALLLTLGAISIASCSQEEDNAMMQEKGNLLKIRTSVTDTRGVITGTTFQKGDEIGICVTTVDGHDYTGNSQNIRATYTGSDWQLEQEVELTDDEAIVYAYYPYNANATDSVDIYLNPTTTPEQTDYLQGSCQGVSINNTTANIQFKHVLTRLTLAVTKGVNDVGEGVISRVRIENGYLTLVVGTEQIGYTYGDEIAVEGKMSIKTGMINRKKVNAPNPISISADHLLSTSEACCIDLLVFPYEDTSTGISAIPGPRIYLTIDESEYRFSLNNNLTWKAGQQYTYPITINRQTVPTPEPTVGEAVYMGFDGDDGQPLYWSSWNLGATSPEDYGGLYGWGDPTGIKTSTNLDDYPNANPPENISGTDYDLARQMWGDGWRMPTSSEFSRLDSNSITEWVTQNGVEGLKFTSEINGNSIFLPYAPYRIGTTINWGGFGDTKNCEYWDADLGSEDVACGGTYYFSSNGYGWSSVGSPRYEGHAIRPVTSNP